jgi:23S rRNA (uracil1939-C5)-methyltransferase
VGSIGLTIGGSNTVLVEVDENAFREMERNIKLQKREDTTTPVLAPSEKALDYIQSDATIIVDPPRVGLHQAVVDKLLDVVPPRIIYLSCNPVTQARDVELLKEKYEITAHQGYNYFPRTPHIEHLVVLTAK